MTCNPNWAEIIQELLPGQTPANRPDLVARVFKLKKEELINNIYKNGIFGQVVAYVYTIEFQKRGLPYIHLLIFLDGPHKLSTPEAVDSCIHAYWPDPTTEPLLFKTVSTCMVHGPCGELNPRSPCMENGRCMKGYPKPFQVFTMMDHSGYPQYYCPDDGCSYDVQGHHINNRWIVPYCPYLSVKLDCHINTKCAISFASVKYIHKYIHKGHDKGTLEVSPQDEIKQFIDGRYISVAEAAWRIFHYNLHKEVPNVTRLQVHLPGEHMILYDGDDNPVSVLECAEVERTTLAAWFQANADSGELGCLTQQYSYQEFPQYFVWDEKDKQWKIQQWGWSLGRMYFVAPMAGEQFYLQTLLSVVKGARSFQELRQFAGIQYETFRQACFAWGLLEDDREWTMCLEDASPNKPERLWEKFRHHICDDLKHTIQSLGLQHSDDNDVFNYGLFLLDEILHESGHTLTEFTTMPQSQQNWHST